MADKSDTLRHLLGGPECSRILEALNRGATRRDVLTTLTAAGMQAALAASLAGLATEAHSQTARRGGRIRVASQTTSIKDTLDPAKQANQTDYSRCNMLYNGLFALDSRLAPQPALAEQAVTKDALTWNFKLRKGVSFHDGKPLTSADVVYSLMRHKDPAVGSKAKALADQIEEVKALGPNEVEIRLGAPNADLPVILGTFHFHIVKEGTTDFSAGIGTGPFKLKEFKPGLPSLVTRNENYWKSNRPYLDEIEFLGIADESARVNALLNGELDLIAAVSPRSAERIRQTEGFTVHVTQSGQYTSLVMRRDSAPGNNPDFVLAMKHLFDRERMLKSIALGNAVVANDQPVHPTNRFHFTGLPQRPFDPDKARFHLRKSGLAGTTHTIVASVAASYSVEMAQLLQQEAQKIDLNLFIKRVPADGYWNSFWMKVPMGFGNVNARPNADTLLTLFFKSDATWNEAGWKNEKFDQVLVAARGETDFNKRRQMYADLQVMIHEQGGIGIPLFLASLDAHSKKLKGLGSIPLGGLMGYSFAEHVWMEA